MGERGPAPQRKANLVGHRSKAELEGETVTKIPMAGKVKIPAAGPWTAPIATNLYNSARRSGQSKYWEESDWYVLWLACDEIDDHITTPRGRSAQKLMAINQMLGNLLLTEGDRRRVGMEIEREVQKDTTAEEADAMYSDLLGLD